VNSIFSICEEFGITRSAVGQWVARGHFVRLDNDVKYGRLSGRDMERLRRFAAAHSCGQPLKICRALCDEERPPKFVEKYLNWAKEKMQ
jgi:hypothetical protein